MPVTGISTQPISPARRAAFEVLQAVAVGAYASDSLRERCANLSERDAGLAGQIVFGCLRFQAQLDYLIFLYSGRKVEQLDEPVAVALRAAIFQLRYLERVPAYAAVAESVEFVKRNKRAATGLANAVLRKVNRNPVRWPDRETELSCPKWLLDQWSAHFGEAQATQIAAAALREPDAYVRVPPGCEPPAGLRIEATSVAGCFRLRSDAKRNLRLHDIGSQAILPLLDLQTGDRYLDLCAAPGNKTLQALETPLSLAIACDVSFNRIRSVPPICLRVVLDASKPLPFCGAFDKIFIDAPCSGTGTLGRNPEIKWRLQKGELDRFATLQKQILAEGLKLLAPGGRLLYATCSLEREENEAVIRDALEEDPELVCEREMRRLPGRDEGDGFYAAVLKRE